MYINIYYLYFVFEIANMEKVEIFIALRIYIKKKMLTLMGKSVLLY